MNTEEATSQVHRVLSIQSRDSSVKGLSDCRHRCGQGKTSRLFGYPKGPQPTEAVDL